MDFAFTPEQAALREAVRDLLRRDATSDRVRAADGFDAPLWTRLATELGVTALLVPEEHGGAGASPVEAGVVVEEAGRALAPVPALSTVVASAVADPRTAALIAKGAAATVAIAEPAAGWTLDALSCTATPDGDGYRLDGVKEHVLDGEAADVLLVAARHDGEPALFAVDARDCRRTPQDTLDLTRRQARVALEATPATRVAAPAAQALDMLWAALAVESIGVARASLDLTVEHLRVREQFGAPLATFQALRHRVADMFVALEAATSSAWYALRAAGTAEFPVVAPLAKLVATEAAYRVTAEGIQLLGGIGFTWEHDAHLYFRRATTNLTFAGDPVALRRVVAARAGI
ncbi:acyl-CoA dehydrogenase family protein [Phytohabitans sp. LJ34]|uniref:acyl-CoA dehydrogenase family protein n=1 Tax=Phytohabitans sp. LJ34 TaxID=3452217 RepID=UPI003F8B71DE